jgi:gliding motility-associated protein GldM
MAGGKETPRQKMIGMMYLVLTALLAMNVAKEVLDAFVSIDNSIMANASTFEKKANEQHTEMAALYSSKPEKYEEFYQKSTQLKAKAAEMKKYLNEFKARIMSASEKSGDYTTFLDENGNALPMDFKRDGNAIITKKDENQENTALVYGGEPGQPKTGEWTVSELMEKMTDYSNFCQGVAYNERLKESVASTFSFPSSEDADGKEQLWHTQKFFHVPLAAMVTEVSTIEANVKRVEGELMTDIMGNFEAKSYKFTNLEAMVIPESSYILRGDTFRAEVFLGAYDKNNQPKIYRNASSVKPGDSSRYEKADNSVQLKLNEKGFGKLRIPTGSTGLGDFAWNGIIEYEGPDGQMEQKYFTTPMFTVAEPALVVSPSKMNVFYRGLPNPVEISVPGVPADKLKPSISGGHTLTKEGNEWIVKPGSGKEAVISVMATMADGSTKKMGDKTFRVKRIPDPVPVFAGKKPSDSTVPQADFTIASGVRAEMENFDFEVSVKVESFNMVFIRDGQVIEKTSKSNRVTDDMKPNMAKVGKGQKVYIEKIVVKMPDGTTRQVSNITLKVV